MAATRGLYYSYISTSQSYSTAKSITNGIDIFNKPLVAAKLDTTAELAVKPIDAIIVAKCYKESTAFLYYTGSTASPHIANYRQ